MLNKLSNLSGRRLRDYLLPGGLVFLVFALAPTLCAAQGAPIVYPSQGQSVQQQGTDESECRMFAQQRTGFNPAQGPAYYSANTGGEMVGGAARGAALGAIGGAIAGDAGKGAAIGAAVGGGSGLLRRGHKQRAAREAQQQANTQYNQNLNTYYRAYGACMQGRGYAVN